MKKMWGDKGGNGGSRHRLYSGTDCCWGRLARLRIHGHFIRRIVAAPPPTNRARTDRLRRITFDVFAQFSRFHTMSV